MNFMNWAWKMKYCDKKHLSPGNPDIWNEAEIELRKVFTLENEEKILNEAKENTTKIMNELGFTENDSNKMYLMIENGIEVAYFQGLSSNKPSHLEFIAADSRDLKTILKELVNEASITDDLEDISNYINSAYLNGLIEPVPQVIKTEDGYVFYRDKAGHYVDNLDPDLQDMTFNSLDEIDVYFCITPNSINQSPSVR